MSKSKRTMLIELEYMRRGLIPNHIKVDDVISNWSADRLKVYHRKFRKVFRAALKWKRQKLISDYSHNANYEVDKYLQKYISPAYYKCWSYGVSNDMLDKTECYKLMLKSRRHLVLVYINNYVSKIIAKKIK